MQVNVLNAPIKTHIVAEWLKRKRPLHNAICKGLASDGKTQTESKGMEKDTS